MTGSSTAINRLVQRILRRAMNRKHVTILGRKLSVRGDPGDKYFRDYVPHGGVFQDAPIVMAWRYCPHDAVCVDVGANIGLSALAFAEAASSGRVLAFEPSPRAFEFLKSNVVENGFTNVECVNSALSNKEGTASLYQDDGFLAGSRIDVGSGGGGPLVQVTTTTLDLEMSRRHIHRLDILKIDVEGFEREVIEGALETLRKHEPICVIEFNSYVLVYLRHVEPRSFMSYLESIFPRIYHFERTTSILRDIKGRSAEFLELNAATGFVDDLVCTFRDLPPVIR